METWRQALAKSITKPEQLAKHLDVDPDAITDVVAEYPMRITPMWMKLIKGNSSRRRGMRSGVRWFLSRTS